MKELNVYGVAAYEECVSIPARLERETSGYDFRFIILKLHAGLNIIASLQARNSLRALRANLLSGNGS